VNREIPSATVARLPVYLRSLNDLGPDEPTCSSDRLAEIAGVNPAQVRKDLSYLGTHGTRGVGYKVADLLVQLREALGLTHGYAVAIVGAGNLGSALSNYRGFEPWGFQLAAVIDIDEAKIGQPVDGLVVEDLADLDDIVAERRIVIGIVATPTEAAQQVADRLVAAGIKSILNFAAAVLRVPEDVEVRRVDLSTELQILTFHLSKTELVL
jgi:redox-sensing transcriptional repressor